MIEFTGERVIPGQVDPDLWNEHIARYAFAGRYTTDRRVLDMGSGTGYGAAELAQHASNVIGIDIAPEAVDYASAHYPLPNLEFTTGSCTQLPFDASSFDVITAFEVIEHLVDWRSLLTEAKRVLASGGQLLVSTPNKKYYGESRKHSGPNLFHEHEFEYREFEEELRKIFPQVTLLLQNRTECFAFHPYKTFLPSESLIAGSAGSAEDAHFFLAICSDQPPRDLKSFVYVPIARNILREREQHILLLEQQLAAARFDRDQLLLLFEKQKFELEEHNRWAQQLDAQRHDALNRIFQLQLELKTDQDSAVNVSAGYAAKVTELEQENQRRAEWARETERRLGTELEAKCQELAHCVDILHSVERELAEKSAWGIALADNLSAVQAQLRGVQDSRWVKVGRTFGMGPDLTL